MFAVLIGIYGLIIGSFINAYVLRWRSGERVSQGRSKCPQCGHTLKSTDLVPVVSWLLLRGKCRYCGKKISFQYPLVELTSGAVFALTALRFSRPEDVLGWVLLVLLLAIFAQFIALAVTDIKWQLLPDRMNAVLFGLVVAFQLIQALSGASLWEWLMSPLIGAGGAFIFFYGLFALGKGKWMGGGDVKLVVSLGFLLGGTLTLLGLALAFNIAAIVGVGLIILKLKGRKDLVPFGPFLLFGAWLAALYGNAIISWYTDLIGL